MVDYQSSGSSPITTHPLAFSKMADSTETLSSLMEHYQLKEEDCNRQISTLHLDEISLNFSRKWRFLPARLKMEDIVAYDIDRGPGDEEEKRRAFFLKWKWTKGSNATYKALICALLEIKSRQDAESVCKLLQESTSGVYQHKASGASYKGPVSSGALAHTRWLKWFCLGKPM